MGTAEPPPGSPWDLDLDHAPLAFLDLEMTGLDVARDRVVQICVERVVGGVTVDRIATLVDPQRPVAATHIHGIDDEMVKGAPPFEALFERVLMLLDGACVVAHAARWDLAFLRGELSRVPVRGGAVGEHYLDTLTLARRLLGPGSHRLARLATRFGLDNERPHDAENDVRVTRAVFGHLLSEAKKVEPPGAYTLRWLWRLSTGRRRADPTVLARAAEAVSRGVDVRVRYRAAGKGAKDLSMRLTEVRADLDPPLVLGYLLQSRGRRELRADRILDLEIVSDR
ncbi:MAG: 3'-5' exonuclease [Myxococcota bacterium]